MTKIAVFCALPPDRNTGMATVDLAAFSVLKRLAPDAEITLYAYGTLPAHSYTAGYLPYGYLDVTQHEAQYFASDIFIFWGDFTHSRSYWRVDRGLVEGKLEGLSNVARETWFQQQFSQYSRYVFLQGLPAEALSRTIVYGSTIITNEAVDVLDKTYQDTFSVFFKNVHAVYFRDALSAAKVSPLRADMATLGCDCALLLEDEDLKQIRGFVPANERKGVGVFFGRSPRKVRMMLFSMLVGKYLGEKRQWIHWLAWGGGRRHRWPYMVFGYKIRAADADTGQILSQLSGHKYIITDTYHLCVNAWRMGIPAICIGEGAKMALHSLGDKKKEVLFEMYGARRFYVFLEALSGFKNLRQSAQIAAESLADKALVEAVKDTISQHRGMAISRISQAIARLRGV